MESALARELAEVRPKADLLVLLAFTDEETLARLAEQFYEIQVILGGNVSQPAQELKRHNRSLIYFVTNESRALGILQLHLRRGAALQRGCQRDPPPARRHPARPRLEPNGPGLPG